MADLPKTPRWVRWALERLLPPAERQAIMDELEELHAHWATGKDVRAAHRRYRRNLRQYPFRLLGRRLAGSMPSIGGSMPFRGLFHAARSLAKVPMLATAIVATVGVGIGGCTAIFAVVDVLYLRPLPYPEAEKLVWIYTSSDRNQFPFSVVDFQALKEQQTSFEDVAAYRADVVTHVSAGAADRVPVASVTPGYMELFGIAPVTGRTAGPEDGTPSAEPTIVVTPGFADRYMGLSGEAPSRLLGETVKLDGTDYRVIGVAPDDFGPLASWAQAFPTLRLESPERKGPFFLSVFARLKDETNPEAAARELRVLNARLFPLWADSYQDRNASWGMEPLTERLQGNTAGLLWALMGSVALLLLTATVNAANLLLARTGGRRRELAVRAALGASRGRIVGHLLTESVLLATGGVVLGILVAHWVLGLLPVVASDYLPRLSELRLRGPVLGFATTLAAGCGLLFGLTSALRGSAGELSEALRAGGRTATDPRRQQRAQTVLVVGQMALVVPLLTGAGLLLSSFARLAGVDPGFDPQNLMSVTVPLDPGRYPDPASRRVFWDQALARIEAIPGVRSVGVASGRPPRSPGMINNFDLVDKPTPPGSTEPVAPWLFTDNGYFATLGIPLRAGRLFEATDLDENAPQVIVVDEAWANRYFPGEEVLGRKLVVAGCTTCPLTTVVGVVGTVPYQGVQNLAVGTVYEAGAREINSSPYLHVRTTGDPTLIIPRIREQLRAVDPNIPLVDFATEESLLHDALRQPRHLSLLLGSFAGVALVLAVVGLYGIVSYTVHRRRGDIAIRLALGGTPRDVWLRVVRQGMSVVAAGLVLGSLGALVFGRVLSGLLFQVHPQNPRILAGVALLLVTVSLLACALPGRRAVRVDPVTALREE